ncbi:hypothetical protein Taro_049530 [Colocasia esculenta]|uniref:Uncharacterized protein n=1 Tax=Colocasia esculenta TaxID=4460 RepID=A0A843XB85_COLES|nr:hypothetical protein [Colocasia esculenta]
MFDMRLKQMRIEVQSECNEEQGTPPFFPENGFLHRLAAARKTSFMASAFAASAVTDCSRPCPMPRVFSAGPDAVEMGG